MKNLRIGTISVALLFISLGIGMLVLQFNPSSYVSLVLTWWPILLILLGLEIIIYLWFKRGEEAKPRYDIVSVFIILFFGMVSIALYTVHESGILPALKSAVISKSHEVQTSPETFGVQGIETVQIIGNPRNVQLYSSTKNEIVVFANWRDILADTSEEAEQLTAHLIETHRSGSTLIITIKKPPSQAYRAHPYGTVTLYIPDHIELSTDLNHSQVNLYIDSLATNWIVRSGAGKITAFVDESSDVLVKAATSQGSLYSTMPWNYENNRQNTGSISIGEGLHTLQVITQNGHIDVLSK